MFFWAKESKHHQVDPLARLKDFFSLQSGKDFEAFDESGEDESADDEKRNSDD